MSFAAGPRFVLAKWPQFAGVLLMGMALAATGVAQDIEVLEVSDTAVVGAQSSQVVRQKLIKDVVQKTAWKTVEGYIGKAKAESQRTAIQRKVIDNSSKYVLTTKNIEDVGSDKVGVTVLLSLSSLRELLETQGFVQSSEGPALVVPLISFIDRAGGVEERWWSLSAEEKAGTSPARGLSLPLMDDLQKSLTRSGFYLLRPDEWKLQLFLPLELRKESLVQSEISRLADSVGAQIVLRGQVLLEMSRNSPNPQAQRLTVQLSAVNSANGRIVAEIKQTAEFNGSPLGSAADRERYFKELATASNEIGGQLTEAWAKGSISSHSMLLTVSGQLTPPQVEKVKNSLGKIRTIRNLRERFFERGLVGFEMDAVAAPQSFVEQLRGFQGDGFVINKVEIGTNTITIHPQF
jgi:hypothetical protein